MKFEELLAKDSKFKDLVEKVGGNLITKKMHSKYKTILSSLTTM